MPSDIQMLRRQNLFTPIDIGAGMISTRSSGIQPFDVPSSPLYDPPIFNVSGGSPITPQSQSPIDTSGPTLWDKINQIYSPETESRDRFNTFLGEYPTYEGPGKARGLFGTLMGIGAKDPESALKVMEGAFQAPHMRDVAAWKDKAQPMYQAAQLENTANVNERNLANNYMINQTNQDKLASQERIANEKNEIARMRAEAYSFKQTHPDWKFDFSGPNGFAYNPNNPNEKINLGPTGNLSDVDKINLQGEWGVRRAEASGAAAVDRANVTNQGAIDRARVAGTGLVVIDGKSYTYNPDTGQYEPAAGLPQGTPTRPGTPPSTRTPTRAGQTLERQDRIRQIFNQSPEHRKMMQEDPKTGDLMMIPKPTKNPAEIEHWNYVYGLINPDFKQATPPTTPTTVPPTRQAPVVEYSPSRPNEQRRSSDGGKTFEYSHDGGKTWGPK